MRKEAKSFQAETKELLNLMIHSIYTHKEIFLRELVSNGSDAIDKIKFKSLTDEKLLGDDKEFKIKITADKDKKEIVIQDNGIGMTYEEVAENIGTIAKSGSKAFAQEIKDDKQKKETDIIGQFGVGFYSAFMIADKIVLETKSPFGEKGVRWSSVGDGSYEIEEIEKADRGTKIILHVRDTKEDLEFLEEYKLKSLIKKYSDYVRYPIFVGEPKPAEEGKEPEPFEPVNSTKPIWKEKKSSLTAEKYNEFYKSNFHDWEDPIHTMHIDVKGNLEYTALLYIPSKTPYDFYTKEFKRGLQLYTKNVFIMDKCEELIPEYFSFVKGLVDCDTLSLNISREILQKNGELTAISKNLEKKIISEFEKIMKDDREKYIKIWEAFGRNIKFGIQDMFGMNKDKLQNLLMFKTSKSDEYRTLKEYVEVLSEDQKEIYYIAGEDINNLKAHPKFKTFADKNIEVLFLLDKIDEFSLKTLAEYEGKKFKSITDSDTEITETEEEKKTKKELEEKNKDVLTKIQNVLGDKIKEVKLSSNLGEAAVSISSKGHVSLEMEKTLSQMPGNEGVKAEKVLEINATHGIFEKIKNSTDEEEIKALSEILFDEGMMIEGFTLKNPLEFINKVNKFIK